MNGVLGGWAFSPLLPLWVYVVIERLRVASLDVEIASLERRISEEANQDSAPD
jgi:hypothetical protein